jgi:hypothetical protein
MFIGLYEKMDKVFNGKYNATQVNREFIIRFFPAIGDGKYQQRSQLITAAQMCKMLSNGALDTVFCRLEKHAADSLEVKVRKTGKFQFSWR